MRETGAQAVQQQSAATAPTRIDSVRPPEACELRQRPLSTLLRLDGMEEVLSGPTDLVGQLALVIEHVFQGVS